MDPALDKETIALARYIHGGFNMIVLSLVMLMLIVGLRIRRARLNSAISPGMQRLHRRLGPLVMALGVLGFMGGALLGYLDNGRMFKYPAHFTLGALLASMLIAQRLISGKFASKGSHMRNIHLRVGIALSAGYIMQMLLGIGILL